MCFLVSFFLVPTGCGMYFTWGSILGWAWGLCLMFASTSNYFLEWFLQTLFQVCNWSKKVECLKFARAMQSGSRFSFVSQYPKDSEASWIENICAIVYLWLTKSSTWWCSPRKIPVQAWASNKWFKHWHCESIKVDCVLKTPAIGWVPNTSHGVYESCANFFQ